MGDKVRLPLELYSKILDNLPYLEIKNFALSSKDNHAVVQEYFAHIAMVARNRFGEAAVPFTDQVLVEMIYFLNNYNNYNMDNIKISPIEHAWKKGNNRVMTNHKNGNSEWSSGFVDGKDVYHRIDGPAYIRFEEPLGKTITIWFFKGMKHRDDGPAVTYRFPDGKLAGLEWYINDKVHRDINSGPARIFWHPNGKRRMEEWKQATDKMAHKFTTWDENGNIIRSKYNFK